MNSDQHFFFSPLILWLFPQEKLGIFWGCFFWASVYSRLILVFLWGKNCQKNLSKKFEKKTLIYDWFKYDFQLYRNGNRDPSRWISDWVNSEEIMIKRIEIDESCDRQMNSDRVNTK